MLWQCYGNEKGDVFLSFFAGGYEVCCFGKDYGKLYQLLPANMIATDNENNNK